MATTHMENCRSSVITKTGKINITANIAEWQTLKYWQFQALKTVGAIETLMHC